MKRALIVHGGCGTPQPGEEAARLGTVGCVALDARGRLPDLAGDRVPLEAAAQRVLEEVGPGAGLIALASDGTVVELRNTSFMAAARRAS